MKNQRRKIMFVILILIFLTGKAVKSYGQENFTLKGNCEITRAGNLYIFLVDEQTSKKAMTGVQELIIKIDSCPKTELIEFSFRNIPKGEYGIRCFLDTNGNGKLDFKLFSAREPWGMSWKNKRKSGIPSVDDYSFTVKSDKVLKTIKVE